MQETIPYHNLDINIDILYSGKGFQLFALGEDIEFVLSNGDKVTAPRGFRTDGCSSPWYLKKWYPTWGKGARAWILHDLLYVMDYGVDEYGWSMKEAQFFADMEMWILLDKINPDNKRKNKLAFEAVSRFGAKIYAQDRAVMYKAKILKRWNRT